MAQVHDSRFKDTSRRKPAQRVSLHGPELLPLRTAQVEQNFDTSPKVEDIPRRDLR